MFNIGLLHTSATGREGHERYAPCTVEGLRSKQYNYWALGHIHQPEVLREADPLIVFPGNLQGRHIRETGPRGCSLVTVDSHGNIKTRFQPLDVFRWELCRVDCTAADSPDDIVYLFDTQLTHLLRQHENMPLAVRVLLEGACPAHERLAAKADRWKNEIRATATERSQGLVWIEKIKIHTLNPATHSVSQEGPMGELLQFLQELQQHPAELGELSGCLEELLKKLPPELTAGADSLGLDNPQRLAQMMAEVEGLLLGHFVTHGGDR